MSELNLNTINLEGVVVEARQTFKPVAELYKGLCIAEIDDVRIDYHTVPLVKENGVPNNWEFAGKTLPNLIIDFKQINNSPNDTTERYISLRETVPSATDVTGNKIDVSLWTNLNIDMYKRLQHIVNAMDKGNVTPKSKALKEYGGAFEDDADVRIKEVEKVMKHFVAQIKGKDDTPKYKGVKFWLKVVADPVSGAFYTIPRYVNRGFIEVFMQGVQPHIEIGVNDSIVLQKRADKKGATAVNQLSKADADVRVNAPQSADEVLAGMGL